MISYPFKVVLIGLVVAVGAGALALLHLDNARMRRRIADREQRNQLGASLRTENVQLRAVLEIGARDADDAVALVHAQVQQAHTEVLALEQRARERRAEQSARAERDAVALATNRNPTQGLTLLENFQDRGQATPTAAFETLVWAVLKGDEKALAKLYTMSGATRAQAEAMIAGLPDDARTRWTPEKLATLWFTGALTEVPSLHITGESFTDAEHAIVTFRMSGKTDEEKVKLKRGTSGWQVAIPGNAMKMLEKKFGAAAVGSR